MPLFRLDPTLTFPAPTLAEANGLLAIGGDLTPERLLLAYSMGIFPWYMAGDPLLWWSPDPRCVLLPGGLLVARSLRKLLHRGAFEITLDRDFAGVVQACAASRDDTWIVPEMQAAYGELHRRGYAHSVECWQAGELVGGLYGVAIGRCFCGESMFHRRRDASKVAFATTVAALFATGYELIDAQLPNAHLHSLGAVTLPRSEFLQRLRKSGVCPSTAPTPGVFPRQLKMDW